MSKPAFRRQTSQWAEYRRSIQDHFATPAPLTDALLDREHFEGLVWECACGEGWMAEVLKKSGYDVLATDLIDRGYGEGGVDFLKQTRTVPNVVTNPPYVDNLHFAFTEHALRLATRKVALLMPAYLVERCDFLRLFSLTPLKSVYFFTRRVHTILEGNKNKDGGGKTTYNMGFAWYVWDKSHRGRATFDFVFPQRPIVSRLALRVASRPQVKVSAV